MSTKDLSPPLQAKNLFLYEPLLPLKIFLAFLGYKRGFVTLNKLKTHIADRNQLFVRSGNDLLFYCIQFLIGDYKKRKRLSNKKGTF